MPEPESEPELTDPTDGDIMAGDRRIARTDTALPDWYVPDASYRPVPIAWFAAAILIQTMAISAIFFALINKSGWLTLALAGIASLAVLIWSWQRGIGKAGRGWQIATVLVMLLQIGFIAMGTSDRL